MPPTCGYSLLSALKQCAQVTTIFFLRSSTPSNTVFSSSMFCWASCWNRNSLPARRAESPVQVSSWPSTMNFTPAVASSSATALVVFLARSS
ncbi:Uncharacterised protein [Mycobacteroides abscessus subsp. abscessus]|nr:Uncharacterised protein [Mycobacteroides abscessus subsp. abscessus]